ncbi:MAG: ketol-acid reductoisomerase [Fimbriimonadaceae bacterium]
MARVFSPAEADTGVLDGWPVAVLGYGNQGRAQALNLRDSGVPVVIGARPGRSRAKATEDGFEVLEIPEAIERAMVIAVLLSESGFENAYPKVIQPALSANQCLIFAHGFSFVYGGFLPPPEVDLVLCSPKGPGAWLREQYEQGSGLPCCIAVAQDYTGTALQRALAYCAGIGGLRVFCYESTFEEETIGNLFGEHAVFCGGLTALIQAGFETLVKNGHSPESAYFDTLHTIKLIADLLFYKGWTGARESISETAEWGDYFGGPKVIGEGSKAAMQKIYEGLLSGELVDSLLEDQRAGHPALKAERVRQEGHSLAEVSDTIQRAEGKRSQ